MFSSTYQILPCWFPFCRRPFAYFSFPPSITSIFTLEGSFLLFLCFRRVSFSPLYSLFLPLHIFFFPPFFPQVFLSFTFYGFFSKAIWFTFFTKPTNFYLPTFNFHLSTYQISILSSAPPPHPGNSLSFSFIYLSFTVLITFPYPYFMEVTSLAVPFGKKTGWIFFRKNKTNIINKRISFIFTA